MHGAARLVGCVGRCAACAAKTAAVALLPEQFCDWGDAYGAVFRTYRLGFLTAADGPDDPHASFGFALADLHGERATQQPLGHRPGCRRLERFADIGELLSFVEVQCLPEERFLVAEGGIETWPRD